MPHRVEPLHPILKQVGVKDKHLELHVHEQNQDEYLTWMDALQAACEKYREIRVLLPEEVWDRYDLLGFKDFHEQKLLAAALKRVRVVWKFRPKSIRKKPKVNKHENQETNTDNLATQEGSVKCCTGPA